MASCSRTLWFLSRDWDTSRTIRSRIQRDVHATKTYSIILLSALISSRQLIERRDGRKRNPFVCRACTYPCLLFLSLSHSRLLIHTPSLSASFANLSARRRPLVAAWKLFEARLSSKWTTISKVLRPRSSFLPFLSSPYFQFPNAKECLANFFIKKLHLVSPPFLFNYFYFFCISELSSKSKSKLISALLCFYRYYWYSMITVSFVRAEGRHAASSRTTPVLAASVASNVSCHWYVQRATWLYQSCDIIINNARYWSLTMHDRC